MTRMEAIARWGGLGAAAGGALIAAGALLLDPGAGYSESSYLYYPSVSVAHLGTLLLLGGLLGLRARRAQRLADDPEPASPGLPGYRLAFCGYLIGAALGAAGTVAEALVGRLAPLLAVLFGFFASLAYLAGELGLLLVAIAVLRYRVLPPPWGALPLAIFLLGVPLAVLALIVFGEGMVLRHEPTAGAPAYLVWDAPEVLVGLAWSVLGLGLFSGVGGSVGEPNPTRGPDEQPSTQ
jgi:hypothetical protein